MRQATPSGRRLRCRPSWRTRWHRLFVVFWDSVSLCYVRRICDESHSNQLWRKGRMTLQGQIVALDREGLSNKEIAHRLGCRPEYVRTAKRRADSAKRVINVSTSQPPTLRSQIVALVMQGCGDIEVAERVGCRREYVRVVRRRAGLLRPAAAREAAFRCAEAKLIATIGSLEAKLADARQQLAKL